MQAAVLTGFGQPLIWEDRPLPEPGPGQVRVRVEACGVCHSDLHLALGEWELLKGITKLPLVLGHEVAGVVDCCGEGVDYLPAGTRVGVPWLHYTCGSCEFCREGREELCNKQQITGVTVDGGYAEYLLAPDSHATPIPEGLSAVDAAPLMCAGLTVYKALKSGGVRDGQRVAVFGVGGLGHLAVQLAKANGAEVIAVDVSDDKLQLGRECGADHTLNVAEQPHKAIKRMGGAHVALVAAAHAAAYESALRSLRKGGTILVVGMAPEPWSVSTVALVASEARIIASAVGTRQDLRELLEIAAAGRVRCRLHTRPLSEATAALEELKHAATVGRCVLTV
jgi:propanol-preferring alcohol dehydrogenase